MSFIRDLFRWFLTGTRSTSPVQDTPAVVATQAETIKTIEKKADEFDIFKGRLPMNFLDELRSIEPGSKALEQAREDLVRELKKLGTFN
jgi:histidyl-tRNA synthetase